MVFNTIFSRFVVILPSENKFKINIFWLLFRKPRFRKNRCFPYGKLLLSTFPGSKKRFQINAKAYSKITSKLQNFELSPPSQNLDIVGPERETKKYSSKYSSKYHSKYPSKYPLKFIENLKKLSLILWLHERVDCRDEVDTCVAGGLGIVCVHALQQLEQ